jgi:electron transfer flavoprotein alpha/beta subunit
MRTVALLHRAADLALVRAGVGLGACTAVTVAPEAQARPLLTAARAAGAVRAVQLWDAALDGNDYLATATALAAAVRATAGDPTLPATLILAGDRGRGAVGPALAERMQLPLLGQVLAIERDGKRVMARRRFRAVLKLYAAELPVVICLLVDENVSLPSAPPAEIEAWTLARAGLTAAELTYRKRFLPHPSPGPEQVARRLSDAHALAERLRADGLVAPPEGR